MLHYSCSGITDENLDAAAEYILNRRGNLDIVTDYLMGKDEWLDGLRRFYPDEMHRYEGEKEAINQAPISVSDEEIERRQAANREFLKQTTINALRAADRTAQPMETLAERRALVAEQDAAIEAALAADRARESAAAAAPMLSSLEPEHGSTAGSSAAEPLGQDERRRLAAMRVQFYERRPD